MNDTVPQQPGPQQPDQPPSSDIISEARTIMRRALKGALATLDPKTGGPYASLVTLALEPDLTPVFLISTLAVHTQNLLKDARASLLFDDTDGLGDPLQGGRVSVTGEAAISKAPVSRARFLARHQGAAFYADFKDFEFYRLTIKTAHYVGGFGKIHDIAPADLLVDTRAASALIEAEPEIIAHMNEDHADAIDLYAQKLAGGGGSGWRFSGCDPEGCDLIREAQALRLDFPEAVHTPMDIRRMLVRLAEQARSS